MDKKELFDDIRKKIDDIISAPGECDEKLQSICDTLRNEVEHYDWVGFYLTVPNGEELTLGPYTGDRTDHTCIPFGKGVCGQAAAGKKTIIIQDVARETNYLSCSPDVKSEIVVPLFKSGEVAGELDIDSHALAPFSPEDRAFLEAVCKVVETII
ncbi:MAG: GAF domain-containing protein [Candidatus Krumholzibacteria bacterium]|nr:GAF domain-containing protein [Candidatus Krumholzibacteria bacterium]